MWSQTVNLGIHFFLSFYVASWSLVVSSPFLLELLTPCWPALFHSEALQSCGLIFQGVTTIKAWVKQVQLEYRQVWDGESDICTAQQRRPWIYWSRTWTNHPNSHDLWCLLEWYSLDRLWSFWRGFALLSCWARHSFQTPVLAPHASFSVQTWWGSILNTNLQLRSYF